MSAGSTRIPGGTDAATRTDPVAGAMGSGSGSGAGALAEDCAGIAGSGSGDGSDEDSHG